MLPYNQSFIVSFVVVVFSLCCESDVEKEEKVEEKGGHFTVIIQNELFISGFDECMREL